MRKILLVAACVTFVMVVASCGSKKQTKKTEVPVMSLQDSILMVGVLAEVDSLFSLMREKMPVTTLVDFKTGRLKITDQEKKVKPDYLMPLSKADGLQTISQQSRALMIYVMDRPIAEMYGMPTDGYDAVITKLMAYLSIYNFPFALDMDWTSPTAQEDFVNRSREIAKQEKDRGAERFLVERAAAACIESIYLFSKNPTVFTSHFSNEDIADITYRVVLLTKMVDKLAAYYPEMKPIQSSLDILNALNATDKNEFTAQLKSLTPQIEKARNGLLD